MSYEAIQPNSDAMEARESLQRISPELVTALENAMNKVSHDEGVDLQSHIETFLDDLMDEKYKEQEQVTH